MRAHLAGLGCGTSQNHVSFDFAREFVSPEALIQSYPVIQPLARFAAGLTALRSEYFSLEAPA